MKNLKNFKKYISFILTVCMILSCFSTLVLADSTAFADPNLLVSEDYGEEDISNWEMLKPSLGTVSAVEVDGEPGNYAVSLAPNVDGDNNVNSTLVRKVLNDGEGYAFEAGKQFVIKTRMKQTNNAHE